MVKVFCPNFSIDILSREREAPSSSWHLKQARLLLIEVNQRQQTSNPNVHFCPTLAVHLSPNIVNYTMHQQLVFRWLATDAYVVQLVSIYFWLLFGKEIPKRAIILRLEHLLTAQHPQNKLEIIVRQHIPDLLTSSQRSKACQWNEEGQVVGKLLQHAVVLSHDVLFGVWEERESQTLLVYFHNQAQCLTLGLITPCVKFTKSSPSSHEPSHVAVELDI